MFYEATKVLKYSDKTKKIDKIFIRSKIIGIMNTLHTPNIIFSNSN